jgi:hypothetical protein
MTLTANPSTPPDCGADEITARLKQVSGIYSDMAELPVWSLTDARLDDRLDAALQAMASAQEMVARIVGEADHAGVAGRAGCSSTRAWLTSRHGTSLRAAAQALAQARAMTPRAEQTRLAWANGVIDAEQAEVIGRAVNNLSDDIPAERVDAAQADLIRHAETLTVKELQRAANRLVEVADPDGADRLLGDRLAEQEKRAYEQSVFRLTKGVDGIARFSGKMPNLTADMLLTNLQAIASPRRDHLRGGDAGAAETAHAAQPDDGQPLLPYGSRLGRAFCELVEKVCERDLPAAGVNATLVVTIDEQRLRDAVGTASLSSGDDLSVSEARRLACNADILPAVLGGDSRPLDLGRASRLFDRYQRTALAVRDGGCVFPGCDRPPGWAEAHHVRPWSVGGKTDLSNGALLCGFHHRLVHADDGWEIHVAPDGIPEVTPPERVDPRRQPIRHQRHRQRPRPAAG